MKQIKLTQGKFALVDDEDFKWLSQWKWYFAHGYAYRRFWDKNIKKYKGIFLHQLICSVKKGLFVDHINRNRLDNRRKNLRSITKQKSRFNITMPITNKSGAIGVCKSRNRWRAFIKVNYKWIHLGNFINFGEAVLARKNAERIYHAI